ncbi:MAG: DUF4870 domain-containing protein [Dysgonomonas sp.]|nr:DUF4870 domain-containing protein [Dysgonomonas sp.]
MEVKNKFKTESKASLWGMDKNTFLTLMHLSQFAGYIVTGFGFILPIIMWVFNSRDEDVNRHGKNILNFMLSVCIYIASAVILLMQIDVMATIYIVVLAAGFAFVIHFVIIIIMAVKANRGKSSGYPFAIPFFR